VLGPAQVRMVEEGPSAKVGAAIFFALLALGIGAILAIPRLIAAWRETDADADKLADLPDVSEATPTLVIPNGKSRPEPKPAKEGKPRKERSRRVRERQGS
jgi:hypothetical protein